MERVYKCGEGNMLGLELKVEIGKMINIINRTAFYRL